MEQKDTRSRSREQILHFFQAATDLNVQDSVRFLNQSQWNVTNAIENFLSRNEYGGALTNSKTGSQQMTSLAIHCANDQHLAELIHSQVNGSSTQKDLSNTVIMGEHKRIAVVAHNNKKAELIECLKPHRNVLSKHKLYGTGTTGSLVEKELQIPVTKFECGPLGGDQQIGAKIAARELDILIFFIDPLDSHPHGTDVRALIRLAQVYGIVCATTAATVDFILTSKLMNKTHARKLQLRSSSKA